MGSLRALFRPTRQEKPEGAPLPFFALHPDLPLVGLHDSLHDREAQSSSALVLSTHLPESVEEPFLIFGTNAGAGVRNEEMESVPGGILLDSDGNLTPRGGFPESILDQVRQNLNHPVPVPPGHWNRGGDPELKRDFPLFRFPSMALQDFVQKASSVEGTRVDREGSCFQASHIQKVLDETIDPFGGTFYRKKMFSSLLRRRVQGQEKARCGEDGPYRVSEVMGDDRQDLVPVPDRLPERRLGRSGFGHVRENQNGSPNLRPIHHRPEGDLNREGLSARPPEGLVPSGNRLPR